MKKKLENLGILDNSILGGYIKLLNKPISENDEIFYLYKLETYYADVKEKDPLTFNESIDSYEQYCFIDFDGLLDFVNKNWGLVLGDFVPIYKTNIPN